MVTLVDMLEAYYDCRKRKRRTASAVVYEMDYEARLIALRDRLNTRSYLPGKSICFVVTNFIVAVRRLNAATDLRQVRHAICSINSYLGLLRQSNEYGNRVKVLAMISPQAWQYIYIKGHYEVVCLRRQYRQKTITLQRIRDGDY